MRRSMSGLRLERALEMLDRLLGSRERLQRNADAVVRIGPTGPQAQGLAPVLQGFLGRTAPAEQIGQFTVRFALLRVARDDAPVARFRRRRFAAFAQPARARQL